MAEKKQRPKWVMGLYVVLPLVGLAYVTEEGGRRWLGIVMLVLSAVFWIRYSLQRKKDSST